MNPRFANWEVTSYCLKQLGDEVFGETNFVGWIIWQHSVQPKGYLGKFSTHHNHILCYRKSDEYLLNSFKRTEKDNIAYKNPDNDPKGPWRSGDVRNALYRPNLIFDVISPSGMIIKPCPNGWRWSKSTLLEKISTGEIIFSKDETRIIRKIYLNNLEGRTPETIWFAKEFGSTRDGMNELKQLFTSSPFDTPKPTLLIKKMLSLNSDKKSIVLDFFSGSATTAHSVMQLNAEDGGNRKFIMVQIPEKCDERSEAFKAGYHTICEIGKERIRRAGEKIRKEVGQDNTQLELGEEPKQIPDIGFRVLKIDSTNMNDVYYGAAELEQQDLFDSESNIKSDRTELDILFGVMLDWGLPLSLPYKKEMIGNTVIHNVEDGALIACFAGSISEEVIISIAKRQATKVVFKDNCFSSSVDRINVEQLFKHYDPTFASNPGKIRVI